jgi:hypothetical protein
MAFISCASAAATYQPKLKDCTGADLPAGTEMATCDALDAAIAGIAFPSVPTATDTVAGKVALNTGTSLPGDATNCTDALTACGLNAILADTAAGGNAVINAIKALDIDVVVPLATTTVAGLIEEATGEETRLGATDPNKDDRAVTPGTMSYALQTGKDYPIHLRSQGKTGNTFPHQFQISGGTGLGGSGAGAAGAALYSDVQSSTITGWHCGIATYFTGNVVNTGNTIGVNANNAAQGGNNYGMFAAVYGTTAGTNTGIYATASGGVTNWAGYLDGNVAGGAYTTLSDATLKENVEAIDPVKALAFRNGLQWKKYEMFTEQQVEIMQDVTDSEGNTTQVPTGRYQAIRNSQGIKRGLIAQEVLALAQSIGDFTDVVVEVGEYFTLDAQGYPAKDAQGNNIVNKRLGIDYGSVNVIVMAGEQVAAPLAG